MIGMTVGDYIKSVGFRPNYCEAIIYPDGSIEDASPSHTKSIVKYAMDSENRSYNAINNMIPVEASPASWMVEHTGCLLVWFNFAYADDKYFGAQKYILEELQKNHMIANPFKIMFSKEKSVVERNRRIGEQVELEPVGKKCIQMINGIFKEVIIKHS